MEPQVVELLLLASQREDWRVDPVDLTASLARVADPDDRVLLTAASSMLAGDPTAALGTLQHAPGPVTAAMRIAAVAMDRNWFPGDTGAVLQSGDLEALVEPPPATGDPAVDALVTAYGRVAAMRRTWRSLAASFGRFGRADRMAADVLPAVDGLRAWAGSSGLAALHLDLTLLVADLHHRARDPSAADRWDEAAALATAGGDAIGLARCHTCRGDWSATPFASPESMGFDLEAAAAPMEAPDLDRATHHYEQAQTALASASSRRGIAALSLRRAHVARLGGDLDRAQAELAAAAAVAAAAGDVAMVQLAHTHSRLAAAAGRRLATTSSSKATTPAERTSSSFHRGLVRLCLAEATRGRAGGDFVAARGAMHVASGLGADVEPRLAARELAELYRQFFPLAAVVLSLGELDAALAGASHPMTDMVAWMSLADQAMAVHAAAVDRIDSAAIAAAGRRLADVRQRMPPTASDETALGPMTERQIRDVVRNALEQSAADAAVLVPLYDGAAARLAGRAQEATQRFDAALDAARSRGPTGRMLEAVVLGMAGRRAEGKPLVDALVAEGALAADHAIALYLRLDDPQQAAQLAADRPLGTSWETLAEAAEIAERTGRAAEAKDLAARAMAAFEETVVNVGRDALKHTAVDDAAAAGLYLTAIRADLADGSPEGAAAAFALSDRCRTIALSDLLATTSDGAAGAAIRAWRRAESRWAATFEELAEQIDDRRIAAGDDTAARLQAAEAELDDAEATLARHAPAVLTARRQPTPPTDLDAISAALPGDSVLVQYHAYGDDLVIWSLDLDGLRAARHEISWQQLASSARRFLDDAAGRGGPSDPAALAEVLLTPVAGALADHERVVIVPSGGLAALPFHLLPFEGDVLGARRVVSTLPAASLLAARAGRPAPALDRGALVVGDPEFTPGRRLRPLPGAETEARAVAARIGEGAELLVGQAATEAAVGAAVPGRSILHLATHGVLSERSPNRSLLALAGDDELTVGDLMGLGVAADLVVLSACDSGRGTSTLGGDVIGLVRAILAGGARHVVVSLWPVDDQAGCLLMDRFYGRLVAGAGVAHALAGAAGDVRPLDRAARAAAYETLRAHVGSDAGPATPSVPRDIGDGASPTGLSTTWAWAPFVHVGL